MTDSEVKNLAKSIHRIIEGEGNSLMPIYEYDIEAKEIIDFISSHKDPTRQELATHIRQVFLHYLEIELTNAEIDKIISVIASKRMRLK